MDQYSYTSPVPGKIEAIVWPPMNGKMASGMTILCDQLDQSQWWSQEKIQHIQERQLGKLCHLAKTATVYYKTPLKDLPIHPIKGVRLEDFMKLPLLKRADLQDRKIDLICDDISMELGPTGETTTSGSTGAPVTVRISDNVGQLTKALQRRWFDWAGLDGNKILADLTSSNIKKGEGPENSRKHWHISFPGGDYHSFNLSFPFSQQMEWLQKIRPHYLTTYPSAAQALFEHAQKNNIDLSFLKTLMLYGEVLPDSLRELAKKVSNAKIYNKYSCRELGCMALECPETGLLHIQSDNVLLEILNKDGSQTKEGHVGKVVVTSLINSSMPLIRYDIGDFAQVGPACSCGRGQATIKNILGRERHFIRLRNGDRVRPITDLLDMKTFSLMRQFQYIQTDYEDMTFKYISDNPLNDKNHAAIKKSIDRMLPISFNIKFERVKEIPRNAGGKFDDIICEISD